MKGRGEGRCGDANADQEVPEQGVIGVQVGVAHVEAGGDLAGMEEVVVAAQVVAVEHLGGGVLAEEGVGAGVRNAVAGADGDGVEVEANAGLGVGRNGRQSESDDWARYRSFIMDPQGRT